MTKSTPRHPQHHKVHRVRRVSQSHGGGGRPLPEGSDLQLPRWRYMPILGFVSSSDYPKGRGFKQSQTLTTVMFFAGAAFLLLVKLLAG